VPKLKPYFMPYSTYPYGRDILKIILFYNFTMIYLIFERKIGRFLQFPKYIKCDECNYS
jgi:hypothetical protein